MSRAQKKMAIEHLSDIGRAAFHLQAFTEAERVEAMRFMRTANPELFEFLVRVLTADLEPVAEGSTP